jgi:hypothetical protein
MSESKKYMRVTLRAFLTVVAVLTLVAITPYRASVVQIVPYIK